MMIDTQVNPVQFNLEDGGLLAFYEHWLPAPQAKAIFDELRQSTPWKSECIRIAGKIIAVPRLTAWYGDPKAIYTYSGILNEPLPWTPTLELLRNTLSEIAGVRFNSVLLNDYRNGNDSMGWHSDSEKSLGINPVIASLSLGSPRRFLLRHHKKQGKSMSFVLGDGALFIMAGTTQHHYRHAVPKEENAGERINLTFRRIVGVD